MLLRVSEKISWKGEGWQSGTADKVKVYDSCVKNVCHEKISLSMRVHAHGREG